MDFSITTEQECDYQEIYNVVKISFQTAKHADGDEHEYVLKLRSSGFYLPELALVLKIEKKFVGHIMLTKTFISNKIFEKEALLLSPVCILNEYRNIGFGAKLIKFALKKAQQLDYKAIFLVGSPIYYQRFGFKSITQFGLKNDGNFSLEYVLALELVDGYLNIDNGMISIV